MPCTLLWCNRFVLVNTYQLESSKPIGSLGDCRSHIYEMSGSSGGGLSALEGQPGEQTRVGFSLSILHQFLTEAETSPRAPKSVVATQLLELHKYFVYLAWVEAFPTGRAPFLCFDGTHQTR